MDYNVLIAGLLSNNVSCA